MRTLARVDRPAKHDFDWFAIWNHYMHQIMIAYYVHSTFDWLPRSHYRSHSVGLKSGLHPGHFTETTLFAFSETNPSARHINSLHFFLRIGWGHSIESLSKSSSDWIHFVNSGRMTYGHFMVNSVWSLKYVKNSAGQGNWLWIKFNSNRINAGPAIVND